MKKSLFIVGLIFLSFGVTLKAQNTNTDHRENLEFGIKAGFNYSNVWNESGQDFRADPKFGFAGGAFLGIPIGKYLGFQPEIVISQKGFKGSGTLLGAPYSFSRTTTYLDIPLQIQVKPAEFLTLLVGPQYSFLLKQKDSYTDGAITIEQQQDFKNENIRKNILGFVVGADFIYSHFVVSGRVGWDFQTNHGDGTSSTPNYKNQWLQFTIGLKL